MFSHPERKYYSSHTILRASASVNWLCSIEFSEIVSVFHGWQCGHLNLQNRLSSKRSSITGFNKELIFHLNVALTPTLAVLPLSSIGSINLAIQAAIFYRFIELLQSGIQQLKSEVFSFIYRAFINKVELFFVEGCLIDFFWELLW